MSNPTGHNGADGPDDLPTDGTSAPSAGSQWSSEWEPGSASGAAAERNEEADSAGADPVAKGPDGLTASFAPGASNAASDEGAPYGAQESGDTRPYDPQTYGSQSYGAPAYGQHYGAQPYQSQQYGAPAYGQQYGAQQYGAQPYDLPQYGAQPYGQPYGVMQPYGQASSVARKDPTLMLIASFFIPGLGTILNGETGKGVGILAGYLIGIPLAVILIGIPMMMGFWIWGMVDAYQGAQRFNTRHGLP